MLMGYLAPSHWREIKMWKKGGGGGDGDRQNGLKAVCVFPLTS